MVFRALLFAVFSGFIGAAPAAPVVAGTAEHGCFVHGSQPQKSETSRCAVVSTTTPSCAAAPPLRDGPPAGAAACPPPPAFRIDSPAPAPTTDACVRALRIAPPPVEDVRAGLLDLPPPTAL